MPKSAKLLLACALLFFTLWPLYCPAQFNPGETAPDFTLEDVYGRPYQLASMADNTLIVLYFFDTASSSSQEGLLTLNKLLKQFEGTELLVWGITKSGKNSVSDFIVANKASFPVMLDQKGISGMYNAEFILPTIYILGPQRKVIDVFQGGGESTEKMLVRLAERELQRDAPLVAQAISLEVQNENPDSLEAKTVYGYAALKADKVDEAEDIFNDLAQSSGEGEILGNEGLVTVYAKKGKVKKAMELAEIVEEIAPERGAVNVVKGDILMAQGKKEEALAQYEMGTGKPAGTLEQKADAHNKLGRLYASLDNFDQARINYDQTVQLDPYNLVAMSNKGVTYQKEGQLDKALEMFEQALSIRQNDQFSAVLAKKTREMLALQKNIAEKERIDRLVKELAARFHSQASIFPSFKDTWTSRPMILSFVDFQEKGGLSERDGMSMVLTSQLSEQLNQSGRVQVVERIIMDRLLEELNLGSSDLADPETALKLGRILAAKIVTTGSLLNLPDATMLNMRLIDTETTAISKVVTKKLAPDALNLENEMEWLNREILQTIIHKYPLQGFIVQVSGDQAILNIGAKQGVVLGSTFEAIEEGEPIKYKGKKLKGLPKTIGKLEVVMVEPDMCSVRILEQSRPLQRDDKVREKQTVAAGQGA